MPVKARLLLVSRKWPPAVGGMETYSVELAASLQEFYEVELLVLAGRGNGAPGLWAYGGFVLKSMLHCLVLGRRYRQAVFCDLILFPAAVCHWLVSRRSRRLVVVYGLDLVYQNRSGMLPLLYRMFFGTFRMCQGVFDSVVAISRHTARLAREAGLRQVAVINPSLPSNELVEATGASVRIPQAWSRGGRRILYFGRLVPRKGALWFARNVMPRLLAEAQFFVVGDTSDAEFRRQFADCERTQLLGRIESPALAEMIRTADVVVMPNIPTPDAVDVEGFGLAAIETTSLGGRLLASRIDGITDAVLEGVTGTLVEPADVDAWVAAVSSSLSAVSESQSRRDDISGATRERFQRSVQARSMRGLLEPAGT